MKKVYIKNFIFAVVFFAIMTTILTVSCNYICKQITQDNIGDTVDAISNTTSFSIKEKLEGDYQNYYDIITNVTSDITGSTNDEAMKNKIAALENSHAIYASCSYGIGGYTLNSGYNAFYINGEYYKESNSTINDLYETDNIIIANLKDEYTQISTQSNESLPDDTYVIYKLNDIILYFKIQEYLENYILDSYNDISVSATFLTESDGKIVYQKQTTNDVSLFNVLRDYGNSVTSIIEDMSAGRNNTYSNISYNGIDGYLVINNIKDDTINYQFYLVQFISTTAALNGISKVLTPFIATFVIVDILVLIAVILIYIYLEKKNNDIELLSFTKYNQHIYKINVKKNGQIIKIDTRLQENLYNYTLFQTISDFNIKEDYDDFQTALLNQKPFTIMFSSIQTKTKTNLIIRFIPLKHYNKYILAGVDVTKDELDNIKYKTLALNNPVTKLPNNEAFKIDLEEVINFIKNEDKTLGKVTIIAFSLCDYKSYLSFYGEETTEHIILEFIRIFKLSIKDYDVLNVYNLDTNLFAAIITSLSNYEQASKIVDKIKDELKRPVLVDSNTLVLRGAFGIYNLDLETYTTEDPTKIMTALGKLINSAKQNINKVLTYDLSIERFTSQEELLIIDIRNAIKQNEFEMYLQPQYDLEENKICGFEMLIRWNNTHYYNMSPIHFIEVAEKNGLIIQIGKFINEETMRIAKILEPFNIDLSVNVSPVQLLQHGFVQEFIDVADKYNVDYSHISIEITETFLMENFDIIIEKLKLLKKKGFSIHLDDFCTGYSSMLYLKELPIDTIKIDKEFTKYITSDTYSRAIIQKIIQLARSLNLSIIAEGVESEGQAQFLLKNNCKIIQGYIVSRPVELKNAIKLLDDYNVNKTKSIFDNQKKKK